MRRIGLVGLGLMGGHHFWALDALARAGLVDARVTVAYDQDPVVAERFAAETGTPLAGSLEALVDASEVVWVATWTAGHLAPALAAAAAGKAVFVEKPLAPTLAECEQLAQGLRGTAHQVGLILRHAPAYAFLQEQVASGRHGRAMGALFRDDQRFPLGGSYGSTWRGDPAKAGGGTLLEHSIHDVDVLAWVLGAPDSVSAQTTEFAGVPGIEDLAMVRLTFPGGHAAGLLSVWHDVRTRSTNRRLEVFCEDAVLWMDGEAGPVHVETDDGVDTYETPMPEYLLGLGLDDVPETWRLAAAGLVLQARHFLDCLDAGKPTGWPTVDDALVAHRAVDAAYRSAAAGGAVVPCGA